MIKNERKRWSNIHRTIADSIYRAETVRGNQVVMVMGFKPYVDKHNHFHNCVDYRGQEQKVDRW